MVVLFPIVARSISGTDQVVKEKRPVIEIQPIDLPDIDGKPYCHITRTVVRVSHNFLGRGRQRQWAVVNGVCVAGRNFQHIPCIAHIQFGARDGVHFFRGTVRVGSDSAADVAERLIEFMIGQSKQFVTRHPHSWFTVTVQQEIRIREP